MKSKFYSRALAWSFLIFLTASCVDDHISSNEEKRDKELNNVKTWFGSQNFNADSKLPNHIKGNPDWSKAKLFDKEDIQIIEVPLRLFNTSRVSLNESEKSSSIAKLMIYKTKNEYSAIVMTLIPDFSKIDLTQAGIENEKFADTFDSFSGLINFYQLSSGHSFLATLLMRAALKESRL